MLILYIFLINKVSIISHKALNRLPTGRSKVVSPFTFNEILPLLVHVMIRRKTTSSLFFQALAKRPFQRKKMLFPFAPVTSLRRPSWSSLDRSHDTTCDHRFLHGWLP